jgi:hypothetical protein
MGFPEGEFERLHAAGVLVKQVAQVRRGAFRVGDRQKHGRTAIMPERPRRILCRAESIEIRAIEDRSLDCALLAERAPVLPDHAHFLAT